MVRLDFILMLWAEARSPLAIVTSLILSPGTRIPSLILPPTCRSWDGLTLYACSSDGSIALFDFDESELEGIVPHSVQGEYLKKFGFEARNAEIRMEQQREKEAFEKAQILQQQQQSAVVTNGAPISPPNVPGQQQVTITKDGRRRIKPSLVGHLSSTGSTLLAQAATIPTAIPTAPAVIPTSTSAPANVSMAEAFATAPMLPFAGGADADGDVDMSVPIDAWGANGAPSATKVNLKPRTLGGDKKREPSGPVKELRAAAGENGAIVVGARVLDVPSIKSTLSCRVEGSEKDADSVEVKNSDNGEWTSQFQSLIVHAFVLVDNPAEINYYRKSETYWMDYLSSAALHIVATTAFVAVALEDGAINFYTNTGRRYVSQEAINTDTNVQLQSNALSCVRLTVFASRSLKTLPIGDISYRNGVLMVCATKH